jgi:hypothetical protein
MAKRNKKQPTADELEAELRRRDPERWKQIDARIEKSKLENLDDGQTITTQKMVSVLEVAGYTRARRTKTGSWVFLKSEDVEAFKKSGE